MKCACAFRLKWLAAITMFVFFLGAHSPGAIRRVKKDATGIPADGTTWDRAYRDLHPLLSPPNGAQAGDEIWVAAGTYTPEDNTKYFQINQNIQVYGGFAGTETDRAQRDWTTNITVLSGDVGSDDTQLCEADSDCPHPQDLGFGYCAGGRCLGTNNCTHVVRFDGASGTEFSAVIDGFTITRGNARDFDKGFGEQGGGGIGLFGGSATIHNCIIKENRADNGGGGIYSYGELRVHIANTEISNNTAGHGGGIGAKANLEVVVYNSRIVGNRGYCLGGGAHFEWFEDGGTTTMVNTLIAKNVAGSFDCGGAGGGLFLGDYGCCDPLDLTVTLRNCTIADNRAEGGGAGGGIITTDPAPPTTIYNSIIWGNIASDGAQIWTSQGTPRVTVRYSNVRREPLGTPNPVEIFGDVNFGTGDDPGHVFGDSTEMDDVDHLLVHDPRFAGAASGDYQLTSLSIPRKNVCIDAGSHVFIAADVLDVDENGDFSEAVPLDVLRVARQLEDPSTIDTGTAVSGCRVVDMGASEFVRPLCPKAAIVSSTPAAWTIDARRPHPTYDASLPAREGLGSANEPILIELDVAGTTNVQCWELCESGPEAIEVGVMGPNQVVSVEPLTVAAPQSVYAVTLERPIAAGQWTTISYLGASGECGSVTLGSLPGDVNGNGIAYPEDTLMLGDILFGLEITVFGNYSVDIDHSAAANFFDVVAQIDLLNGAGLFVEWFERSLPTRNCQSDRKPTSAGEPVIPAAGLTEACMFALGNPPVVTGAGDPDPAEFTAYLDLLRAACAPLNNNPSTPSNPDEDAVLIHRRPPVELRPGE